jgi:hypothetical protein
MAKRRLDLRFVPQKRTFIMLLMRLPVRRRIDDGGLACSSVLGPLAAAAN